MQAPAVLRRAARDFVRDGMSLYAAALAFLTLLAVVPLFALAIVGASLWLGEGEETRARMEEGAAALLGDARGEALQAIIEGATPGGGGALTLALSVVLLLFAATRLFGALASAFNVVWDVKPEPTRGWRALLLSRFTSWGVLLGAGFVMLVALGLGGLLASLLPSSAFLWQAVRLGATFVVTALVLSLLYWKLPDAEVEPRDAAWAGAIVALLLTGGERALSLLVGGDALAAVYGGLAAVIAALLWFYYASLLLLAGAELAHARAVLRGERPPPSDVATRKGEKSGARSERG